MRGGLRMSLMSWVRRAVGMDRDRPGTWEAPPDPAAPLRPATPRTARGQSTPAAGAPGSDVARMVAQALSGSDIEEGAARLRVAVSDLWIVARVEAHGVGFAPDRTPTMLFERHYFSRLTGGRFDASHPELSHPRWGGYGRADTQTARLRRAASLDYAAALRSASWGLGQVMGVNAEGLGYADVETFVDGQRRSEGDQLIAMVRFIDERGLARALRRRDWTAFARGYSGPSAVAHRYEDRLAQAAALYADPIRLPNWSVRAAQLYLSYFGHLDPSGIDGVLGRKTRAALEKFLADAGRADVEAARLDTVDDALVAALARRAATLPNRWPLAASPRQIG